MADKIAFYRVFRVNKRNIIWICRSFWPSNKPDTSQCAHEENHMPVRIFAKQQQSFVPTDSTAFHICKANGIFTHAHRHTHTHRPAPLTYCGHTNKSNATAYNTIIEHICTQTHTHTHIGINWLLQRWHFLYNNNTVVLSWIWGVHAETSPMNIRSTPKTNTKQNKNKLWTIICKNWLEYIYRRYRQSKMCILGRGTLGMVA